MAEKTHWPEEKILNMPFFKVLSYIHVFNIRAGIPTDWAALTREQVETARANFSNLFKK